MCYLSAGTQFFIYFYYLLLSLKYMLHIVVNSLDLYDTNPYKFAKKKNKIKRILLYSNIH